MKQKSIIFILSILLCLSLILPSCSYISDKQEESEPLETEQKGSETRIKELEAQIITLLQSQEISESERKKEISALKSEIEAGPVGLRVGGQRKNPIAIQGVKT